MKKCGVNLLEALSDNIVVDMNKCVFCGVCVETCVLDNLRLKLAPCRQACPLGVNCQGYVQLIARGRREQALSILRETLPFPGILARVCSRPCEDKCHRAQVEGQAVAVRDLKRFLADAPGQKTPPLPEKARGDGKKVAVVGAGPAGLMAAHDLLLTGREVVMFDRETQPGGLLRWGVPAFRLPLEVLERELGLLFDLGLKFQGETALGRDLDLDSLEKDFDAVVLALGGGGPLSLGLNGENLPNVYNGLDLLKKVRDEDGPNLEGRVVVLGGGNSAVDAAQTALRLGASEVTLVSLEAEGTLPAFRQAIEEAAAEGVRFECGWGTAEFREENGRVVGLDLIRCTSVWDECGVFSPCFDRGRTVKLDVDSVIVAIGQKKDAGALGNLCGEDGTIVSDPLTLQTSREKIFAAGDILSGPGSVVEAMAGGRRAAESVDRFLKGEHLRFGRSYPGPVETEFEIDVAGASEAARVLPPVRPPAGPGDFGENTGVFSEEQALAEAGRCYSCGSPFGKYRTCWFCLPCEVECPEDAMYVEIPYLLK